VGIYLILVASASSWVLAQLSGVAWQSWMADLVPEHIRASFFGRRGAIISFANMLYYLLIQLSLDYVPMYWQGVPILYVYAVVFAVTGAFGTLDIIIHSTIPEPKRHPGETQVGWREFFEPVMNPNFLRFSLAIGLFGFTTGIFSPFQAPYVSLDLEKGGFIGASNKWVWVMMAVPGAIGIFTLTAWGHMMDRFGRKPVVVLGALFPLAWVAYLFLTPANYWIIIPLVAVAVGLLSAGYMTGVFQLMLTLAPQKNRTGYAAWHNSVAGVIGASGSILGGYLKQYAETVQLHTQIRGIEINFPTEVMGFPFSSFHVVGVLCFVLMVPTLIMLSRIREGKERPVGFLVSLLTNPGTYRTFLDLGAIGRASSPRRTARALRHLDGISGNLALAEVLARLDDPDPDVREEAARALGRIRAPETVEPLIQHLRDPACTIRPEAAYALGQIGDARAVPALVENLSSPTPEIQDACARALEMIRKPRPRSERSAAALRTLEDPPPDILINMIIERLDDTDADVREAAVRALGRRRSPDAIEALVARLRDPGSKIRSQAALTLGEIGDAQAIPALVDCLSDPSVEVQDACARALGDIGSREAVRHLMRLVHEKSSERVMAAGAEAVSRHGIVEAAWEIVPRMHETSNPVLRRQLAIAAGNLLGTPGRRGRPAPAPRPDGSPGLSRDGRRTVRAHAGPGAAGH
jgi:HEAT repeat protein